MTKKIVFTIVFAAIILGLVQLYQHSDTNDSQTANIGSVGEFQYPSLLEIRNDIPFKKLIDPEFTKNMPDSLDYEVYRPEIILLKKGFNADDPEQLKNFANITISGGRQVSAITDYTPEVIEGIKINLKMIIQNSLTNTSYKITEEKPIEVIRPDSFIVFKYQYKQVNAKGKTLNIIATYFIDHETQISATLSAPEKEFNDWVPMYDNIVSSIKIKKDQH